MKTKKLLEKKELIETIKELYFNEGLSERAIHKRYKSDGLTRHNISYVIKQHGVKDFITDINKDLPEDGELQWEELDGVSFALFCFKSKCYKVPEDLINELHKNYSSYGDDLTQRKVQQKFGINKNAWHAIKKHFDLTKDSNIVSEYTFEQLDSDGQDKKIQEMAEYALNSKKQKLVNTFDKLKDKEVLEGLKIKADTDYTLSLVREAIKNHKVKSFSPVVLPERINKEYTVLFSDIHYGKKNSKSILRRLGEMFSMITSKCPAGSTINLICLGDLLESYNESGMHPGQVNGMDKPAGLSLMLDLTDILEEYIYLLSKHFTVNFYGLAGNHDRFETNHKLDINRKAGLIMYELIKRGLRDTNVNVNYFTSKWNKLDLMGYNFILHHGDDNATSINPYKILHEFGKHDQINIVAMGDKHHKFEMDTSDKSIKLIIPALAGRGEYDTRLGLSSFPGFMIVTPSYNGLPKTTTYRLTDK